jgi:uroporphyrinogen decarboxylase
MTTKIQRLEKCLSGDKPDRTPVALWRHFPVDDQTPEGLASATLDFQRMYDLDLIKVTPASSFCLRDWGAEDVWRGAAEGTREYTKPIVNQPEDWKKLSLLDPYRGSLGNQLTCLNLIQEETRRNEDRVPVLQTIFSPLSQAKNLVGKTALVGMLRQEPSALQEGLKLITESTMRFLQAAITTGIDGIFYAVQHASYDLLTEEEFRKFGLFYDLQVLQLIKDLWLNILHLHGETVMFKLACEYPVQVVNWHDRDTPPSLQDGLKIFPGAVCGGLQRERTMVLGNPISVRAEAMDSIQATGGRRFILGTGCVMHTIVPRANILAARYSVE